MAIYTCQEGDAGRYLRAVVTGTDCYSGIVTSVAVGPVEAKGSSGTNEPGYTMDLTDVEAGTMPEEWTVASDGQFTVSQLPEEAGTGKAIEVNCTAENTASVSFGKQGSVFYAAVDLYVADWGPITADEGAKYDIAQFSFGDGLDGAYGVTKLFTWGDCGGEVYMTIDGTYACVDGGQLALTETGWYRFLYRFDLNNNTFTVTLNDNPLYKDEACEDGIFSTEAFEISTFTMKSLTAESTLYLHTLSITDDNPNQSAGLPGSGYTITTEKTEHGSLHVSTSYASYGQTVTITASPDAGYKLASLTVTDASGNDIHVTKISDTQYTFTMPYGKVTIAAGFVEAQTENVLPFGDVDVGDWYYDAVAYAYGNGLMRGVGADVFAPNNTLNRAMMVQVLWNLEGTPAGDSTPVYTDVRSNAWYYSAVQWATEAGLVVGHGNGTFGPGEPITREQMALMLYNYAQYKGCDTNTAGSLSTFADADAVSEGAEDAVRWAVGAGLFNGKGNGILDPAGTATRAEVAQILMNFCENILG